MLNNPLLVSTEQIWQPEPMQRCALQGEKKSSVPTASAGSNYFKMVWRTGRWKGEGMILKRRKSVDKWWNIHFVLCLYVCRCAILPDFFGPLSPAKPPGFKNRDVSQHLCNLRSRETELLFPVHGESNLKPNYMNKCLRASIVHKHDRENWPTHS